MKKLLFLLLASAVTMNIISCRHKDGTAPVLAELTIVQPERNHVYMQGEPIQITGTVTGLDHMHGYKVCIINSSGDSICQVHNHTHANKIDINETWTDTTGSAGAMRVIISSAINHEGDEVKKEIPIRIEP